MADYLELLSSKAFKTIKGVDYNRIRAELTSEGGSHFGYTFCEVPLMEDRPWAYLRDKVYPDFARYMKLNSGDPEDPDQVVVAVFYKDRCFLVEGTKFMEVFREVEGLNSSALHFRILRWLAQEGA